MPITQEDTHQYDEFVFACIRQLGCFDYDRTAVVWHYTDGRGLLGILESGTLYATQVACLNDSTEVRYASGLFSSALERVGKANKGDSETQQIIDEALVYFKEDPALPANAPLPQFVSCFSAVEDDISQWRGYGNGENGYSIGFHVEGLLSMNSLFAKVNYDRAEHDKVAEIVANKTVDFYKQGLRSQRSATAEQWAKEFLPVWDERITSIAPLVKNPCFKAETEYRLVHLLVRGEISQMRFVQKETLMSRHLPLKCANDCRYPALPIAKIVVGPCRHPAITCVSVHTALRQMGYSCPVEPSKTPFQKT